MLDLLYLYVTRCQNPSFVSCRIYEGCLRPVIKRCHAYSTESWRGAS